MDKNTSYLVDRCSPGQPDHSCLTPFAAMRHKKIWGITVWDTDQVCQVIGGVGQG